MSDPSPLDGSGETNMSALILEGKLGGPGIDDVDAAEKTASAASQWQRSANSKWGTTAVWIHGDGRFAVLQPCSDQLTVSLCGSLVDAARLKKDKCCSRCSKSRHMITDLGD
jgi:hypothetical protein